MRTAAFILAVVALLGPGPAAATERILDYHSAIDVLETGAMVVTERIRVQAEGDQIRRGIYRDFPLSYRDRTGNRYEVGFELLGVGRDGRPEPHHTERITNGIRIYAGEKGRSLPPGEHTYTFHYRTDRQLGFFDDHDELYWNVTGNDWAFPIEQASARVTLPADVPPAEIRTDGYTGRQGGHEKAYTSDVDAGPSVRFQTVVPLGPKEGLTLVVAWPKGYVHEPTAGERLGWMLADNREALAALVGIALVLVYYLAVWRSVGRDPQAGVTIPQYEPPEGFSPGAARFIRLMGHDHKAFATALVNLAVLGYLEIDETARGAFTLRKTGRALAGRVGPGEAAVASALFGDGGTSFDLAQRNHKRIARAIKAHKRALRRHYEKTYFLTNGSYLLPGVALSLATVAAAILMVPGGETRALSAFLSLWLSIWTLVVAALVVGAYRAWRGASGVGDYGKALIATLFALPFLGFELAALFMFGTQASVWVLIALFTLLAVNYGFYEWMKAPTLAGRRLMDRLDGFRLYLSLAEKDELEFRHPPQKTPELFERYLPFAMALDVEQAWAERFEGVLARAQADGSYQRPVWYRGDSWRHGSLSGFTSAVGGALAGAVASSSSAPGSSSGMGGGSSGGGGGGGGGGGW
ncbi:MAG: DUF2207 domain-containing protein [Chromatiales bacterium]|jgi:hypothetical protein